MLLLFFCVSLLFSVVVVVFFNMTSIGTVEFRYYVVIIITVNLGKP